MMSSVRVCLSQIQLMLLGGFGRGGWRCFADLCNPRHEPSVFLQSGLIDSWQPNGFNWMIIGRLWDFGSCVMSSDCLDKLPDVVARMLHFLVTSLSLFYMYVVYVYIHSFIHSFIHSKNFKVPLQEIYSEAPSPATAIQISLQQPVETLKIVILR